MPSDYAQITCNNIRKYGTDETLPALLVRDLYSDKAHFIFELLQNAEDAKASKIRFAVFQDRLVMMHDGRPFTKNDVKGVCGIGKSQKADDLTKIGRFGVGFKAVYAYTNSPEIHSGDEHFRIKKYVRPHRAKPISADDSWSTLFVFPFDKDAPDPKTAFSDISKRLSTLNTRALLFLRSIQEIEYTAGETNGIYRRAESAQGSARKIELIEKKNEDKTKETWIVFERDVRKGGDHAGFVELGFRANDEVTKIESERDTSLVVYFPTKIPTLLGFCIQGPYRTTLARDIVPEDDSWNKKLVTETAELTVDALRQLKAMGLLTIPVLETLPINADDFRKGMFNPIFTRVKEALLDEALLPADDGSFVAGRSGMLAESADLMKLLDRRQFHRLFALGDDLHWLSSDIKDPLRQYLIAILKVKEVTREDFASVVTEGFLTVQSDAWTSDFYCFLANRRALWQPEEKRFPWSGRRAGVLRNKAILRLRDGSHVIPFRDDGEPAAYLPSTDDAEIHVTEGGSLNATSPPIVRAVLTRRDEAKKFLRKLGLRKFDVVEDVLNHVLPKYKSGIDIPHDDNRDDLAKIERAYNAASNDKRSRLRKGLSTTPFILCSMPATGKQEYRTANKVYFRSDELCSYFEGNETFGYIDPNHAQRTLFAEVGVKRSVRVKETRRTQGGHVIYRECWGDHQRGRDGFDLNLVVDGLERALDKPTIDKSAFIWKEIAIPYYRSIRGKVESSSRQNYLGSETKEVTSPFGSLLIDKEWLPDKAGKMHKPSDLSVDDLHESFERGSTEADQLTIMLGMVTEVDPELLDSVGVSQSGLDVARIYDRASPEKQRQFYGIFLGKDHGRPDFPTGGTVKDPKRRQSRVRREYSEALQKEYEQRSRSVRTTRNTIDPAPQLRQWYTNESGQMVCQICKNEMPFKMRDGEYYVEKREVLSRGYLPREHASQFLSLCPLCAAKYKHFVIDDPEGEAMEELRRALIEAGSTEPDGLEAPLKFGKESATLRFVPLHVSDLKAILKAILGE